MKSPAIDSLFASNIRRQIEEVIKVDQTDETILREEIDEYVVTDAIRKHYTEVLDRYSETPGKPHEGIGVWVSGFFGSGKSSFAKILGLALSNRPIAGGHAGREFGERTGDTKLKVLLATIAEKVPTHAVIFDVSTDRGIRSGNQTLTEIMYGLFLQSLGYAKDLDLSELEIALEEKGELAKFESEYARIYKKSWSAEKGKVAFALSQASNVLHELDPVTFPMADSWVKAVKDKADITPGKLAERATELMKRRKPGHSLVFVVDEVGQFVARDVQKMLDLQAIVQNLGRVGRGKHWVVVTSQEKLDQIVSGLDDKKIELARLMDRFPLQVHLEPSDITEVTSRRVLAKNAAAQSVLGKRFDEYRSRLAACTRVSADIRLPELARDAFIELYPLLPYQIDLVIQVVSGLRTQGGAGRQVGGANRTIIKLAQQLLINPAVNLADQPVDTLVRLDQVYDLVEGNIGSEVRARIAAIPQRVDQPLAQAVAKTICLLQYVQSVPRTAENIAACLHASIDADSCLAPVREALVALEKAHLVRQGDDGYRIPTPAEDDWEKTRNGLGPRPGDVHRLHSETVSAFWKPQPSTTYLETKAFKAGLAIHGRADTDGDVVFHLHFAEDGKAFETLAAELRQRSREERRNVFWAVALNEAIDRETVELYRSKEMLDRKERDARTAELKRALDALLAATSLEGLPGTFHALHLLRDEKGKTAFHLDDGPLAKVLRRIEERSGYGDTTSGRWLADEFEKEPFGWDFEAVRKAGELEVALTDTNLELLVSAKVALAGCWPILEQEASLPEGLAEKAATMKDLLARETFFRDLPAIQQNARALDDEYTRRHEAVLEARVAAYSAALVELAKTPGWEELDDSQRVRISSPLQSGATSDGGGTPIPQLRYETEACASRLKAAIAEARRLVEGERLVSIQVAGYFGAGVETAEQLDAALEGIREECARLIGAGKKVVVG